MFKVEDQDPILVAKIRKCAADMIDVADLLQHSGCRSIPSLEQVEQSIRLDAVQLYGYFPAVYTVKAPTFQLQALPDLPQKHISNVNLTGSVADIPGLL